ncbi:MAG TPA: hypothetical protein PLY34_18815 [Ferruginibacter sp.]|nr:hypothetical protein [Ferruginibacter sp.]
MVKREKECGLKEKRRKVAKEGRLSGKRRKIEWAKGKRRKEGRLRGQRMQHGLNSRLTAGPQSNAIISFSLLIS